MSINIRQKGAGGEREIAARLNDIIRLVLHKRGELMVTPHVQRNQNQTAVGGCDLTGTFDFAIEIKRQEALSIETWWKQCCASASELGKIPVLIFKQNRKKWRVVMLGTIGGGAFAIAARCEISLDDFEKLFKSVAEASL
jgi:hypothetical protein